MRRLRPAPSKAERRHDDHQHDDVGAVLDVSEPVAEVQTADAKQDEHVPPGAQAVPRGLDKERHGQHQDQPVEADAGPLTDPIDRRLDQQRRRRIRRRRFLAPRSGLQFGLRHPVLRVHVAPVVQDHLRLVHIGDGVRPVVCRLSDATQNRVRGVIEIRTRDVTKTKSGECGSHADDCEPLGDWTAPHQVPVPDSQPASGCHHRRSPAPSASRHRTVAQHRRKGVRGEIVAPTSNSGRAKVVSFTVKMPEPGSGPDASAIGTLEFTAGAPHQPALQESICAGSCGRWAAS